MKLKQGFVQRKVAGENILIPIGAENIARYNGMITLNSTAAYICTLLKEDQTRDSLVSALLDKYEVDRDLAEKDVDSLLGLMREQGMLTE